MKSNKQKIVISIGFVLILLGIYFLFIYEGKTKPERFYEDLIEQN